MDTATVKSIIYDMQNNHKDWEQQKHELVNTKKGIHIWTANGMPFLSLRLPFEDSMSSWNRARLYIAIQKLRNKQIQDRLKG